MPRTPGSKDISPDVRVAVAMFLAKRSEGERLRWGAAMEAAELFGISPGAVAKIIKIKDNPAAFVAKRNGYKRSKDMSDEDVYKRVSTVAVYFQHPCPLTPPS
ncbi:hypothetical protein PHYBOEH_010002 [Phytophthora boehmeriae]|uniref:Uncharacterized protein n=1 Tax=Phytophthora boehmeriae TaxID=109152 RepID=A0A8T1VQ87_9STRA|nr:hypothetical protein PHYBOEH_010002 [Phytophthora boehmeriae]